MNEMELEDLIQQSLNTFYQARSKKLYGLKLRDIFRSKNPYFIRAIVTRAASKVVDRLLEMYVSSNEDINIHQPKKNPSNAVGARVVRSGWDGYQG